TDVRLPRGPQIASLFPYTTLFRSGEKEGLLHASGDAGPVEGLPGPALAARDVAVEEEPGGARVALLQGGRVLAHDVVAHAHRLQVRHAEGPAERVLLVAVELQQARADLAHDVAHLVDGVVAEQRHRVDHRRQRLAHGTRLLGRDTALAAVRE